MNDDSLIPATIARRLGLIGLLLLVVAAAALRSRHLDDPLWIDELHTAWAVSGDLGDLNPRAAAGNQAPGAFAVNHLVCGLLGVDELTLRLPSYLASLALVALVPLLLMRSGAGWTAALLSGLLMVVDHWSVVFACEARPYAQVQLLSVLHAWCLLGRMRLIGENTETVVRRWRIGWIVTAVLLVMLHYTTLLLILAEMATWWIVRRRFQLHDSIAAWLLDNLVVAICCLPLIPQLAIVAGRRANWRQFIEIPSLLDGLTMLPVAAYLALPLLGVLVARLRRPPGGGSQPVDRRQSAAALTIGLLVVLPLAAAWLSSRFDLARLFHPRYVIATSGLLIMLCGILIGQLQVQLAMRLGLLVGSLVVGLGISGQLARTWAISARQEYWPAALSFLAESDPDATLPVFLCAGLIEDQFLRTDPPPPPVAGISISEFCLFPLSGPYQLANKPPALIPLPSFPTLLPAHALHTVRQAGGGWLIVRGDRLRGQAWIEKLLKHSFRVRVVEFGRVHLLRFEDEESSAPGK